MQHPQITQKLISLAVAGACAAFAVPGYAQESNNGPSDTVVPAGAKRPVAAIRRKTRRRQRCNIPR